MKIPQGLKQVSIFLGVGALNTFIDFAVLNALFLSLGVGSSIQFSIFKAISFLAAATNSYFLNKRFTFKSKDDSIKTVWKFFTVTTASFLLNVAIASGTFFLLAENAIAHPILAGNAGAVLGTGVALVTNFLGYKFLVFKRNEIS